MGALKEGMSLVHCLDVSQVGDDKSTRRLLVVSGSEEALAADQSG